MSNGFAVMTSHKVDKCSAANFQNLLQESHFFNMAKNISIGWCNMWAKHNANIFETSGASTQVFSMASVKSCITKLPLAAIF